MHNNASHTKTSLCADVQLNSTNLDFQPIIITCALFPPDPSILLITRWPQYFLHSLHQSSLFYENMPILKLEFNWKEDTTISYLLNRPTWILQACLQKHLWYFKQFLPRKSQVYCRYAALYQRKSKGGKNNVGKLTNGPIALLGQVV